MQPTNDQACHHLALALGYAHGLLSEPDPDPIRALEILGVPCPGPADLDAYLDGYLEGVSDARLLRA